MQCTIGVWYGGVGKCMCFLGEAMRLGNKFYPDVLAPQAFIGAFKVVVAVGASCVYVEVFLELFEEQHVATNLCMTRQDKLLGKGPPALK